MTKAQFIKNVTSELGIMRIDEDLYFIDEEAREEEANRFYNKLVNIIKISAIKNVIILTRKVEESEFSFIEHFDIILSYGDYQDIRLNGIAVFSKDSVRLI